MGFEEKVLMLLEKQDEAISRMGIELIEVKESVKQLNGRVEVLDESVKQLNGRVEVLDESVKQLNVRVEVLDESVKQLNGRVEVLEGGLERLHGSVAVIEVEHGRSLGALHDGYQFLHDDVKEMKPIVDATAKNVEVIKLTTSRHAGIFSALKEEI
jgi:predicted nuclease with TOPRIM domain